MTPLNSQIADRLREASVILGTQGASTYLVNVYRRAAKRVDELPRGVDEVLDDGGFHRLISIPDISVGIGRAIIEMLRTGHWGQLDRWRGETDPEKLFATIPGVGPRLAHDLHESLHADSLMALEVMAHDGRLERVRGVGPRKAQAIRDALTARLAYVRPRRRVIPEDRPPVGDLLDVDREYRARADTLPRIAPQHFNPEGRRWLPILHTDRGTWHFTALFSNTRRAHALGHTHDWVVVFFYDDQHEEHQSTVVTEHRGALTGERVVRGREEECLDYYRREPNGEAA